MSKSKLDQATELVETAADSVGKKAEQVGKVAKIAKEAGISRTRNAAPAGGKQAPPTKAAPPRPSLLARRRAKKEARLKATPALATARAYVARALLHGALLGTGAILLVEYLAAAQGSTAFLIPLIILGFIGLLALGFRLAFASLRPRVDKTTAAKVAALRVAADAIEKSPPLIAVPASPTPVPDRVARAIAKLFRHYGGGLQGLPDELLTDFARVNLIGKPLATLPPNPALVHWLPVLQTLCRVLRLPAPFLHAPPTAIPVPPKATLDTFHVDLVKLFDKNMRLEFPIPLIETLFTLFPIENQAFGPHLLSALIRGIPITGPDTIPELDGIKMKFLVEVWDPIGQIVESLEELESAAGPVKKAGGIEKYAENQLRLLAKVPQGASLDSPEFKKGLDAIRVGDLSTTFPAVKIDGDAALEKELLKFVKVLLEFKHEYLKGYNDAEDKGKVDFKYDRVGLLDGLFQQAKNPKRKNAPAMEFVVSMQSMKDAENSNYGRFVSDYNNTSHQAPVEEREPLTYSEDKFKTFVTSLNLKEEVTRHLYTYEPEEITAQAALAYATIAFLQLIWRVYAKTSPAEDIALPREFMVSQFYKTSKWREVMKDENEGPEKVPTGYDYYFNIQYPGLDKPRQEYLEVTSSGGGERSTLIAQRVVRFVNYQLAQSPDDLSEITVAGVFFNKGGAYKIEFYRADLSIISWVQDRIAHWKTQDPALFPPVGQSAPEN